MTALLGLRAQECSSLWFSAPSAQPGQMVAYSCQVDAGDSLAQASAVVATDGYFRLYVNGNLTSLPSFPLARAPWRAVADGEPVATRLDIGQWLRPGMNRLTLLCAPAGSDGTTGFSLRLAGTYGDGRDFDAEPLAWLCRPQEAFLKAPSGETLDGREHFPLAADDCIMAWQPAVAASLPPCFGNDGRTPTNYEYIARVVKPQFFSVAGNERSVSFDFGAGFYGLLRVTIRNTRPGQRLFIDGSEYICRGKDDEQFVLRFSAAWHRKVYISGDSRFQPKNVSKVEGLQIVPKIVPAPLF